MKPLVHIKHISSAVILFFKHLGDTGIFAIWAGAIILAGSLLWGLSVQTRANKTAVSVNKILAGIGEHRRLEKPLSFWGIPGGASEAGSWFNTSEGTLAVVWMLPVDGIFTPFLTMFNQDKDIETTVPLTRTASIFVRRLPEGIPELWTQRIWQSAQDLPTDK